MTEHADTAASPAAEPARPRRAADIALWVLQILTGLFLAGASGVPKLLAMPYAVEVFERMGADPWFMYLIGALEVSGGIALMIPVLSGLAGLCFIGLMVGAFVVEVGFLGGANWMTPIIVGVLVAVIAWGRRRSLVDLARLLRGRRS